MEDNAFDCFICNKGKISGRVHSFVIMDNLRSSIANVHNNILCYVCDSCDMILPSFTKEELEKEASAP